MGVLDVFNFKKVTKFDGQVDVDTHNKFSRKELVNLKKLGYNLDWIKEIQPQGGIKFEERFAETSDGYFQCVELTEYSPNPNFLWLGSILVRPYCIGTVDTQSDSKSELVKNLDRSLDELADQQINANHQTDQFKAAQDIQAILGYVKNLQNGGEIPKKMRVRVFIYAPTQKLLEERVTDFRNDLMASGYKGTVFLFEPRLEFDSLFMSLTEQNKLLNNREPFSISSLNIGGGIPFHHQSLVDPDGYPFGETHTGGSFIFDLFFKNKQRLSYNGAILGTMGAGKSNTLKMMLEAMVGSGNMVRGIDIAGDFKRLVKEKNGAYISLDGSDGMINPLEVLGTIIKKQNNAFVVDQAQSFMQHLSKVSDQFRFLNPDFDNAQIQELRLYLRNFYIQIGLVPKDFDRDPNFKITDLNNDTYPIMTDFYNYLLKVKLPDNVTPVRKRILEQITISIKDIITNYGKVFDGHSTIKNLSDQQLVYFSTGDLKSQSQEIFRCQIYTALSLTWNHALQNGIKMKYYEGDSSRKCIVFLDECHNIINTDNIFAVNYITRFEREMRKFLAGVWFATQSPEEMVPENASSKEETAIKSVFQYTTYKFLMRTDSATIPAVKRLLGDAITSSEYELLPQLKVGQAVCNFGANQTYNVQFKPSKEQLVRFEGGR
ncbi:VirB4 family type IV secretion system protein (plasmid) [Latilactobacillus sakei]